MKKVLIVLVAGFLLASAAEAVELNAGKLGIGVKVGTVDVLAVNVKAFVTPQIAIEADFGVFLTAISGGTIIPFGGGVVYHLDPMLDGQLVPYVGGQFAYWLVNTPTVTVPFGYWGVGKGGVEFFMNDQMSVFGGAGAGYGEVLGIGGFVFVYEAGLRFYVM